VCSYNQFPCNTLITKEKAFIESSFHSTNVQSRERHFHQTDHTPFQQQQPTEGLADNDKSDHEWIYSIERFSSIFTYCTTCNVSALVTIIIIRLKFAFAYIKIRNLSRFIFKSNFSPTKEKTLTKCTTVKFHKIQAYRFFIKKSTRKE